MTHRVTVKFEVEDRVYRVGDVVAGFSEDLVARLTKYGFIVPVADPEAPTPAASDPPARGARGRR